MPGYAWGIPARYCQLGSQLRKIPDTPCASCYALKGRFVFPNVQAAYEARYQGWLNTDPVVWIEQMMNLIAQHTTVAVPYFRWFDSGDLQSVEMLEQIVKVAERLPNIYFWLPTQERDYVRQYITTHGPVPDNLVVRVSGVTINGFRSAWHYNASIVMPREYAARWESRVAKNTQSRYFCPAPLQDNQCKNCRACWNREVTTTLYLQH